MKTIIKWYNRDEFSDVDMRKAKEVADRLRGKREISQLDYDELTKVAMLKSRQLGTSSYKLFLNGLGTQGKTIYDGSFTKAQP